MKLIIMQFSSTSCVFGTNILLSILFSNTLSLCSSLKVREQVSHPYTFIFFPNKKSANIFGFSVIAMKFVTV
jgi:hypothetical protein